MAVDIDSDLTRLKTERDVVRTSIERVQQNGQSFRKGGGSGFSVEFADLPKLYQRERELSAKIETLEMHQGADY